MGLCKGCILKWDGVSLLRSDVQAWRATDISWAKSFEGVRHCPHGMDPLSILGSCSTQLQV